MRAEREWRRKEKRGERFRALELFLRVNTDLSTRRHSWKRNLIREKLNSFKCTSRSLFTPLSPLLSILSCLCCCFPLRLLIPPLLWSLQSPEHPPRFPPPLSTLAPFSYPLILSQSTLFHCENVVRQFTSPFPLSSYLSYPFPFYFLSVWFVASLSLSPFLLFMFKDVPLFLLFSFFPLSLSEKPPFPDFFSITLFPIEHCPSHALSRNCSTSSYLTLLINSWHKSLRFSLFHSTRPSLEARKIESGACRFLLSWIGRLGVFFEQNIE